jgi:two-component system sensor histidine kinase DegS
MSDFDDAGGSKDDLVELLTQELTSGKRRLTEIKDQINAMQTSVDREQNRYSGIAIDLRNLKDNLDTVPREDIRDKYDEALDVRFRLATMRGQLEKFEATYEYLEQKQTVIAQILSQLQGISIEASTAQDNGKISSQGLDIIGIIRAQEDERMRLSRALHDGPAQSLTNFILQAEICQRLFDRNPERAAEELNNLKTNASSTFQKVREFIFDLRPMMLDDLGPGRTVRRYVEAFAEKNDIETKIDVTNEDRRLEKHREVLIFRGVQDAIALARDYGMPSSINVRLDMSGDAIKMLVQDDGRGFDVSKLTGMDEDTNDARIQALNMLKSKFELVGGKIDVRSGENEGTTVRLELPAADN